MIKVGSRAHPRPDRAGEPLDGLVNMFDIGIVLAVAFLIAGLQALHLTGALTHGTVAAKSPTIVVRPNQKVQPFKPGSKRIHVKGGKSVGEVYQLPDGRYVLVKKK